MSIKPISSAVFTLVLGLLVACGDDTGADRADAAAAGDGAVSGPSDAGRSDAAATSDASTAADSGMSHGGAEPSGMRTTGSNGELSLALSGLEFTCSTTCQFVISGAYPVADDKLLVLAAFDDTHLNQVVRRWEIFRLDADGEALDPGFGTQGRLVVNGGDQASAAGCHALDTKGRIVLLNHAPNQFTPSTVSVTRYSGDGEPDTDFGTAGEVLVASLDILSAHSPAYTALTTLAGDRVLFAGRSNQPSQSSLRQWLFVVLDEDGAHESALGGGQGYVTIEPPQVSSSSDIRKLLVHDDQVYVLGIGAANQSVVSRLHADLTLDEDFGTDGFVTLTSGLDTSMIDLLVDGEDRLVVVGYGEGQSANVNNASSGRAFHVYRYTSTGELDLTFGTAGKAIVDFGATPRTHIIDDTATSVQLTPTGKLLVVGHSVNQTNSAKRIAMARLTSDGQLDPAFHFNENRFDLHQLSSDIHLAPPAGGRQVPQVIVVEDKQGRLLGLASRPRYSATGAISPLIESETPVMVQWWK